jgi:signal transduction histidine kinase/DNA-binding response OmpR family regulator
MMKSPIRILVIDDSEDDRALYRRALKKSEAAFYDIIEAESGEEGLVRIGEMPPACVLLDYSLPGHDGIEVLKRLHLSHPFVPVVMLTGQGNEIIAVKAMQEGAQNYISKAKITPESLQSAIRVAIDHCVMEHRIHEQHESLQKHTRELAEQKRLLAQAQSMAHIGNWCLSLSSQTFEWSDEMFAIHGVDRDFKPTMQNMLSLIHEEDRAHVDDAVARTIDNKAPGRIEYRIVRPNGDVRNCSSEGFWERSADGMSDNLVGYCQDVTESKALAQQLHQAQKMEVVGQLTGGIAHDFNNLLTVIISNLDMILAGEGLNPAIREMAEAGLAASLRSAELTRQLLAFSRKQKLERKTIDPNELVTRTATMLKRAIASDVIFHAQLAPDLWLSDIDPSQLESAITNLVVNARDAMPKGGTIAIETANIVLDEAYAAENQDVSPGEYAMFAVSDTGCGIPSDILSRVFEPFFTTKEVGNGTGLGLSMVYGFMKQSGGHVKIYSERKQGTVVRLYLPRSSGTLSPAASAPDIDVPVDGHETILVVEDDEQVRRTVTHQLKDLGYAVLEAENAAAALAIMRREHVDLLFTDVTIPGGVSGPDLAHAATAQDPRLKVLMTSGFTELTIRKDNLASRFALLSKPYRRQELAQRIRHTLHGAS